MRKPVVYAYDRCGTCRKALAWLIDHTVDFETRPIREQPPTQRELRRAKARYGDLRRVLSTSGSTYRELGGKAAFAQMTEEQLLDLLSREGNLVKRPFVVLEDTVLVGFVAKDWDDAFR